MTSLIHPNANKIVKHKVKADQNYSRLDSFIASALDNQSRTRIKTLILQGYLSSKGETITDPSHRVKQGTIYTLTIPTLETPIPEPEDIKLEIIFEDTDLIVINKPAGLVVHPAPGNNSGTLVNALLAHCGDSLHGIGGVRRPGIVHRLDKHTSGLMVAAKNDSSHNSLSVQFSKRTINRAYQAVVWGIPRPNCGIMKGNIGRHKRNRKKMAVLQNGGKSAITKYKVIKRYSNVASLLECKLSTGRTHQIRVHMAEMGHPVIGDSIYGGAIKRGRRSRLNKQTYNYIQQLNRQALHAFKLGFKHPKTEKNVMYNSKLPIEIRRLISLLEDL
tara:strand:+ start:2659 stop:3651 length:993 start_codon:yes stop_codon:yes gene_type:complete